MWALSQPASVPPLPLLSDPILHHHIAGQPNQEQAMRAGMISAGSKQSASSPLDGLAFLEKPHLGCIFRKPACCVQRGASRQTSLHAAGSSQAGREAQTYPVDKSVLLQGGEGTEDFVCVSSPGLHGASYPLAACRCIVQAELLDGVKCAWWQVSKPGSRQQAPGLLTRVA